MMQSLVGAEDARSQGGSGAADGVGFKTTWANVAEVGGG